MNELAQDYQGFSQGDFPTLPELFARCVALYGDKIGYELFNPKHKTYTFSEADREIARIAALLKERGCTKGDHIMLSGKNAPMWIFTYHAILRLGAVVVPIDPHIPLERIIKLASFAQVKALVADKSLLEDLDRCTEEQVDREDLEALKAMQRLSLDEEIPTLQPETQASEAYEVTTQNLKNSTSEAPQVDDLACIMFTSGTTGNEKGVMLTHRNITSNILMTAATVPADDNDAFYLLLPSHHIYTMVVCICTPLHFGAKLVFGMRFALPEIKKDLKRGGVSIMVGIPMLYNKILRGLMKQVRSKGLPTHLMVGLLMRMSYAIKWLTHRNVGAFFFRKMIMEKVAMDQVRLLICGGGPLSAETARRYNELGFTFIQGYGLTETSPILTLMPQTSSAYASVGKAYPGIDIRISNPDSEGNGEVEVQGANICLGYYRNREATAELFSEDGYLKTGDVGHIKRGHLYLTGRSKNMIVTEGGKNVFPEEIEEQFQLIRSVGQIVVLGYQDESKEGPSEQIRAIIVPSEDEFRPDQSLEERAEKLIHEVKRINAHLLPYQRVSEIWVTQMELPATNTKKIKRMLIMDALERTDEPIIIRKV